MVLDLEKDPTLIRQIQQTTALLEQLEVRLLREEHQIRVLLGSPVVLIALEEVRTRKPEMPTGMCIVHIS